MGTQSHPSPHHGYTITHPSSLAVTNPSPHHDHNHKHAITNPSPQYEYPPLLMQSQTPLLTTSTTLLTTDMQSQTPLLTMGMQLHTPLFTTGMQSQTPLLTASTPTPHYRHALANLLAFKRYYIY
jgi:hypothetical protein